jgi:hypothetical protein
MKGFAGAFLRSMLVCFLLAAVALTIGCDSIAGPDPALTIHADVAGYWLTAQPSKSDLMPPMPTAPAQAPALLPAQPTTKPAAAPVKKTSYMPNAMPTYWSSSMPTCNGPNCRNCPADCGQNCPNGVCENVVARSDPAWQQSGQRVQSTAPLKPVQVSYPTRRRVGFF